MVAIGVTISDYGVITSDSSPERSIDASEQVLETSRSPLLWKCFGGCAAIQHEYHDTIKNPRPDTLRSALVFAWAYRLPQQRRWVSNSALDQHFSKSGDGYFAGRIIHHIHRRFRADNTARRDVDVVRNARQRRNGHECGCLHGPRKRGQLCCYCDVDA